MTDQRYTRTRTFGSLAALFLIIFAYYLFDNTSTDAAGEFTGLTAVHLNNQLQVNIPFEPAAPSASGTLAVELLDAEDRVISRQLLTPDARSSTAWRAKLMLPAAIKREDLVWYRLRYRFIPQNQVQSAAEAVHSI